LALHVDKLPTTRLEERDLSSLLDKIEQLDKKFEKVASAQFTHSAAVQDFTQNSECGMGLSSRSTDFSWAERIDRATRIDMDTDDPDTENTLFQVVTGKKRKRVPTVLNLSNIKISTSGNNSPKEAQPKKSKAVFLFYYCS
jgi:hypothetical protein